VSKEELDTLAESQPYLAGFLKESLPSDAKRWIAFGPISKWPESSRLEAIIKAYVVKGDLNEKSSPWEVTNREIFAFAQRRLHDREATDLQFDEPVISHLWGIQAWQAE
jgi:hypothetical protein